MAFFGTISRANKAFENFVSPIRDVREEVNIVHRLRKFVLILSVVTFLRGAECVHKFRVYTCHTYVSIKNYLSSLTANLKSPYREDNRKTFRTRVMVVNWGKRKVKNSYLVNRFHVASIAVTRASRIVHYSYRIGCNRGLALIAMFRFWSRVCCYNRENINCECGLNWDLHMKSIRLFQYLLLLPYFWNILFMVPFCRSRQRQYKLEMKLFRICFSKSNESCDLKRFCIFENFFFFYFKKFGETWNFLFLNYWRT